MMGRGGSGSAQALEPMDIGSLLELVGDDQRYKAKLQELQAQVIEANRVRELAVQTNMQAEENRRAVREMLEQAKAARADTLSQKEANERLVAECDRRRKEVEIQIDQHNANVKLHDQAVLDIQAKLAAREQACQDREATAEAVKIQSLQLLEQAKLNAAKLERDTAEAIARKNDLVAAAYETAEKAKQESLRIKDVIAQKHSRYNEFVKSLAAEQ